MHTPEAKAVMQSRDWMSQRTHSQGLVTVVRVRRPDDTQYVDAPKGSIWCVHVSMRPPPLKPPMVGNLWEVRDSAMDAGLCS